jgi:hypothetical protein
LLMPIHQLWSLMWRPRFLISRNSRSNGQQWSNHGQPGPSPRKTH